MSEPSDVAEPLSELPEDSPPMNAMRGAVIVLDWAWLREHDVYDRYVVAVGTSRNVLEVQTSEWVAMPVVMEHYRALDALGFTDDEAYDVGLMVAERVQGSVLRTMIRLAGKVGVTPWFGLGRAQKLWARNFRGGGVLVRKTSATSASFEVVRSDVARSKFFRASLAGGLAAGLSEFCKRFTVQELPEARTAAGCLYSLSWQ